MAPVGSGGDLPAPGHRPEGPAERIASLVARASGRAPAITPAEAVRQARWSDVAHFLHARLQPTGTLVPLTTGLPASPGAASGRVALSAAAALEAAGRGEAVILVRTETSPDDVLGMQSARGMLTARGGLASHAAVVARGWGTPAVVGASALRAEGDRLVVGDRVVAEGDLITIDGGTGEVWLGASEVVSEAWPPELDVLLGWADRLRAGRVAVRANADDASDARRARTLGAEGIGLCRTEHMFLREDRLALVRRLILSQDPLDEAAALAELEDAQRRDLEAILVEVDGAPVTVRLLDPPLHEFLPDAEHLVVAEARGQLDEQGRAELAAVRQLHQVNPMMGTRGIRLGVVRPSLYPMQVRALCRAAASVARAGRVPDVEVLVPLVVDVAEVRLARRWVEEARATLAAEGLEVPPVRLGAMIETPRAALTAGALAEVADFVSFGTNDLTQLTYGFSRDDVEADLLPRYLAAGLLAANPFEVLDAEGVGRLVQLATTELRQVRPGCTVGVCGEHAGDPASARLLVSCGVDHVSCSPYRVPVARLTVAQALLEAGLVGDDLAGGPAEPPPAERPPAAPPPAEDPPVGRAGVGAAGVDDDGFSVLHALRVKGFAQLPTLVEATGSDPATVRAHLDDLVAGGSARAIEARGLWQLTPAGRHLHADRLPPLGPDDRARLHATYQRFLVLNTELKELCTAWQLRDGRPNEHDDAGYDGERLGELAALDARAQPVVGELAGVIGRLGAYGGRLAAAAARTATGEREAFTGVLCGSYHDVWMELHEDLLVVLGIDRVVEGSD